MGSRPNKLVITTVLSFGGIDYTGFGDCNNVIKDGAITSFLCGAYLWSLFV